MINIALMQDSQKKKQRRKKTVKKRKYVRSEYDHYQPNSPLTQHYITTGAILPQSKTKI